MKNDAESANLSGTLGRQLQTVLFFWPFWK